jgi:hypothetical protein
MEALQPRPISNGYVTEFNPLVNDNHDLPSPPTPFPVDLLRPTDSPTPEQRRTVYTSISAIQDSCVQALSALLPEDEETLGQGGLLMEGGQQLASALTELLEVCYELETFRPPTPRPPIESLPPTASSSSTVDIHTSYAALTQHLSDLQSAAQSRRSSSDMTRPSPEELHPAINVVREELAWARVDSLSHAVLQLVRARGEQNETHEQNGMKGDENTYDPFASSDDLANGVDALPPSYSQVEHDDDGADHMSLPGYHDHPSSSPSCPLIYKKEKLDKPPRSSQVTSPPASREKMIRELDAVTVAIERLYAVTPQMLDQRVELRTSVREGWEIERDKLRELEEIWDRIERAHGKRRMWDDEEEAVLEGGRENSAVRVSLP